VQYFQTLNTELRVRTFFLSCLVTSRHSKSVQKDLEEKGGGEKTKENNMQGDEERGKVNK
jgi:hypothetical protein